MNISATRWQKKAWPYKLLIQTLTFLPLPPHSVHLYLLLFSSSLTLSSSSHQATCQPSVWRCKFSSVGSLRVILSPPSSRSWWCAGSWLTTSASTRRNTTAWRVSCCNSYKLTSCILCLKLFSSWGYLYFYIFLCSKCCFICVRYSGAYEWAQKTLKDHAKDKRPYLYTREQLEKAKTHDKLWNGAQVPACTRVLICLLVHVKLCFLLLFIPYDLH